ncbi:MAG: DegT/DnrJ/EryC1/StrS family aminotransferase [Candidatus Bathyarchaeia archaeon]
MIPINTPTIGKEEIEAVTKVMHSGILTNGLGTGPKVTEFETNFAKFTQTKHAIAVNTGTAALHTAIIAASIKPGDEVILPSFTFVATAEAVVIAGGKPVFADIDPATYNLSPEAAEKATTKNTKAIVPVDLYGLSADMKPIQENAEKHSAVVVEDAAQAHGSTYHGKPPGTFAQTACWSLYASKNITTGEGGMVTTNDDTVAETVKMARTHGEKAKYASSMLGYNYRMSEIQAAIGVAQLKKLPAFLEKRTKNAMHLSETLSKSDKLLLPSEPKDGKHSWYLYTARLRNGTEAERNRLLDELHKKGIGAEAYYVHPVHTMPFYAENFGKRRLPETEKAAKQVFSLPVHPGVTDEQVEFIGRTVLSLL